MSGPADIEEIFTKYRNKIYRLGLSISRNEKDAEDILQNTFLKIINNLKRFRKESLLSTWIYKIAYNEALMLLRKRRRQQRFADYLGRPAAKESLGLFVDWSRLPDEHLLDKEFKERVDSALRQMPIKYRMPLLLNNTEKLSLKDTAGILGLGINSVKTRLHRARLMIKSEISGYLKDRQEEEEKKDRKCSLFTSFIHNYTAGRLDNKKKTAFKRHIEDCAGCKSFLDTYTRAINITHALQCQDIPPELQARLDTFLFKHK